MLNQGTVEKKVIEFEQGLVYWTGLKLHEIGDEEFKNYLEAYKYNTGLTPGERWQMTEAITDYRASAWKRN